MFTLSTSNYIRTMLDNIYDLLGVDRGRQSGQKPPLFDEISEGRLEGGSERGSESTSESTAQAYRLRASEVTGVDFSGADIDIAINNLTGLVKAGLIDQEQVDALKPVEQAFSIRITPTVLTWLNGSSPGDPVYDQYMPSTLELEHQAQELLDPIGDQVFEKCKGITHRYPDRVLLKPTHTCQVYCRFCFRREKVGNAEETLKADELSTALQYIREHEEIWEVILTGGDPLILSDRRLADLLTDISSIDHVQVIRFHTRVPLVDPARVTPALLAVLKDAGKTVHMVVHVNHVDELMESVVAGLALLVDHGIPLFSQTVLLKGVNDDAATLAELFRTLVVHRVKPYYLHHLDRARGVGHFRTTIEQGQAIMQELRGRVSGICLPNYVLDIPGGFGKIPIGPVCLEKHADERYRLVDVNGQTHDYIDDSSTV